MNTIIIAAIGLVILVVLILLFTGRIRTSAEGTQEAVRDYTGEKCEIPGTLRSCRAAEACASIGGIDNGALDCGSGICCSK